MIQNLWKHITIVCGNHEDNNSIMDYKQGPASMFYSCPKYYPSNVAPGERCCSNRINFVDFEKIVDKLSDEIEKGVMSGQNVCLTNYKFKVKTIEVTVLEHTGSNIAIKVLNKKAIKM